MMAVRFIKFIGEL